MLGEEEVEKSDRLDVALLAQKLNPDEVENELRDAQEDARALVRERWVEIDRLAQELLARDRR